MPTIANSLGLGSGIDTAKLVTDLAAAQRAPVDATIKRQSDRDAAQVSALAQVRSGLDAFVSALDGLRTGGDLSTQPASADAGAVAVARDTSSADAPAPLDSHVTVLALASAQTVVSGRYANAAAPVGQGTLVLAFGTLTTSGGAPSALDTTGGRAPVTITIGAGNDSLGGLRDAINAAKAGVTASLVDDGQGVHLVLRGTSGAKNGFTLTGTASAGNPDSVSPADLGFAPGQSGATSMAAGAANARAVVDGVTIERATNRIADALPGYVLTLGRVDAATPIALRADRDTTLLKSAVSNYVSAYNELLGLITSYSRPGSGSDTAGPLYGQSAIRTLARNLSSLSAQGGGGASSAATLAGLGVKTARDGTLSVDDATLSAAIAVDPGAIERLFAGNGSASGGGSVGTADTGIVGAVRAMRDGLTATGGGFTSYAARLATDQARLTKQTADLDAKTTAYSDALTKQFGAMEAAVAQYKSIGTFLTQQIDAWNNKTNH